MSEAILSAKWLMSKFTMDFDGEYDVRLEFNGRQVKNIDICFKMYNDPDDEKYLTLEDLYGRIKELQRPEERFEEEVNKYLNPETDRDYFFRRRRVHEAVLNDNGPYICIDYYYWSNTHQKVWAGCVVLKKSDLEWFRVNMSVDLV